jgi:hypothetical protein
VRIGYPVRRSPQWLGFAVLAFMATVVIKIQEKVATLP